MVQDWVKGFVRACIMQDADKPVQPQDLLAEVDEEALSDIFHDVCEDDDNLPFVQRLMALAGPRLDVSVGFGNACNSGALAVAQWLWAHSPDALRDGLNDVFVAVCWVGDLPTAQWLASLGAVDIHHDHDLAFRHACGFGKDDLAEWLVSLGGVDIHANDDEAARTLARGQWNRLRWLLAQDTNWSGLPAFFLRGLRTWSTARDAWMRSITQAAATTLAAPAPVPP